MCRHSLGATPRYPQRTDRSIAMAPKLAMIKPRQPMVAPCRTMNVKGFRPERGDQQVQAGCGDEDQQARLGNDPHAEALHDPSS